MMPSRTENASVARRGLLFVLSSPSGAGKTTLAKGVLAADPDISMSVSVTTRPPRPGERDGHDYHFVDVTQFDAMRGSEALLEWANVFDNSYGTPKAPIAEALKQGRDVLFDIDWQGAQQLKAALPGDVVSVFVLPPSAQALETRLRTRAQDPASVVARRMAAANSEISHWAEYDYVVINVDVEDSLTRVRAILAAERMRRERMPGLADFVRRLQKDL